MTILTYEEKTLMSLAAIVRDNADNWEPYESVIHLMTQDRYVKIRTFEDRTVETTPLIGEHYRQNIDSYIENLKQKTIPFGVVPLSEQVYMTLINKGFEPDVGLDIGRIELSILTCPLPEEYQLKEYRFQR